MRSPRRERVHPPNIPPRPRAPGDQVVYRPGPLAVPFHIAHTLLSLPLAVINTSLRLVGRTVSFGFSLAGMLAHRVLPPSVAASLSNAARTITAGPPAEDPAVAANVFIQAFTAKHGDRVPRWQACGWQEAAARAHGEGKFLFVYLHSSRHQDADSFCENTLAAPAFVDYVNATFLSWAGDVRSSDAFRLSTSLRAAAYPYCALLAFSGARTRLVTCVEGCIAPEALAEVLQAALVEHGSMLWQERAAQEQRERDRQLREEQDAEYQRSLEADMERERQAAAQREAAEEAERQRRKAEAAAFALAAAEEGRKAEAAAALERRRSEKRLSLPEEPAAGVEGTTLIRIRLPNGATHQRRFMASDVLQVVQDWVDGLDSHEHLRYSLATTYPRRVLSGVEYMGQNLEALGLTPQAVVLVQPEDDN